MAFCIILRVGYNTIIMNIARLNELLSNEPKYRLLQVKQALFRDYIADWNQASVLPKDLREKLEVECPLNIEAKILISKNKNAVKALISLADGLKIETVLMKHKDKRNTVCVSTQVGCPFNCLFCATGKMGYKRNLEATEIVEQALFFARYLKTSEEKITNIVFMGMGEPFLNSDNLFSAIKILNDKDGFNLGARRMSVSTVGIIDGIKRLANEKLEVNLAISLHAPDDFLRTKLMPVNEKYSIDKIINAVDDYIKRTNRKVMFEYILIKGLNDSDCCAMELARLMKNPLYVVNLVACNPTGRLKAPDRERIKTFKEILQKAGVAVTERYRFGLDIKAACGQLAGEDK